MRFVLLAALLTLPEAVLAQPDPLGRPAAPVVLSGDLTGTFRDVPPGDLVAFRYGGGAWTQIPVQVDERFVVDYAQVYNNVGDNGRSFSALAYADAGTFTGPDPDATLDADDEVVFMAADAGAEAPEAAAPAGVTGDRYEVRLGAGSAEAFVYLFQSAGGLDPAAGADYVRYRFRLGAGSYKPDYDIANGPNPEDTDVETDHYARHFSDRWVSDEMRIGGGADVLDRLHIFYGEGRGGRPNCARSEDTFSNAEGAFVTNKDGPIRAIRAYVGANSGPLTERAHLFYARREDIVTTLRVHSIPGIHDVIDYEPGLPDLRYTNNVLAGFLTVDGAPDADVPAGQPEWEAVTGDEGSAVSSLSLDTNLPSFQSGFYRRDDAAGEACTGDERPIGMAGVFAAPLLCTDPTLSVDECQLGYYLVGRRVIRYDGPDLSRDALAALHAETTSPITVTVRVGESGGGNPTASEPAPRLRPMLSPVVPNPSTGSASARLTLPEAASVRAEVFDALGRHVETVYDGPASGTLVLRVGRVGLSPGVYALRVQVGPEAAVAPFVRGPR